MGQRIRRSRMFGWDGNPLRRRIDRLEGFMVAGLIGVFLITAPVLAAVAGHWASTVVTRQEHTEATWQQVPAIVQRSAPGQQDESPASAGTIWMRARWIAPDGQARSGWVPAGPGTAAGSTVHVWVNRSGSVTPARIQHAELQGWIVIAEVLTPCGLALALFLIGHEGRLLFAGHRLAMWDKPRPPHAGED